MTPKRKVRKPRAIRLRDDKSEYMFHIFQFGIRKAVIGPSLIASSPRELRRLIALARSEAVLRDVLTKIGTYREGQVLMCGDDRLYLVGRDAREALAESDRLRAGAEGEK